MKRTEAAWVALSLVRGIGGVTMRALIAAFGEVEAVLAADERDLRRVRGVGPKTAAAICTLDVDATAHALVRWREAGVSTVTLDDAAYPTRLQTIPDPPATLFTLGTFHQIITPHVAVIGTRQPSPQSQLIARRMGRQLAEAGAVVISGCAIGVDGLAQTAALEVTNSYAMGVLGSGVLRPYPPENHALIASLQLYGLLLCEVAPDAIVSAPGLVARNRIITGLADAVVVIETKINGGAMHAARAAVRQGRHLYAVDNDASGNRALLDDGLALPLAPDLNDLLLILQPPPA